MELNNRTKSNTHDPAKKGKKKKWYQLYIDIEEHNSAESTSDRDTLQSLLNGNIKSTSKNNRKQRRRRNERPNALRTNNLQDVKTNNLVNEACVIQPASKKDTKNISVSPKTADLLSISNNTEQRHNNAKGADDKDTSNSPHISKEDARKNVDTKRNKSRRALNHIHKNNLQIVNSSDEAHSLQVVNNRNDITPKTTNSSNICIVKRKNVKKINDKDTSILQSSQCTFYDIDYDLYEVHHAMIETFILNIYFFLCENKTETLCLVCDKTFRVPSNLNLKNHCCKHIKSNEHINLLSDMIEDHKICIQNGKFFSKLTLAREFMKHKNDVVECLLCGSKDLPNEIQMVDKMLHEHIASEVHQNIKLSWSLSARTILKDIHSHFQSEYNARRYRCEFCNYESASETCFAKHLRVAYHTTRLIEIPDYMEKFKFHFCAACLLLWYGNNETYDYHNEKLEHQRQVLYGSELNHLPEEILQLLIFTEQNVESLFTQSRNVCMYYNNPIDVILHNLTADLRGYLPNIKAYPFGSRISDLAFFDSDLDIFLDCENMYDGKNSSYSQCQNLIALISCYLSRNKVLWKVQEIILQSRTPIAKVQHLPSGLTCDISVTNGLAVENTKLIKCFNNAFPTCRKLILFLKRWLHLCGLLGSRFITSYALTWCVIFYLQILQVFPSISKLLKSKNSSWRISGWKVGVSYDIHVKKINYDFKELLFGFFVFYGDFKYESHVVCPLLGKSFEKSAFSKISSLPKEMESYVAYMRDLSGRDKPQAFCLSSLCVQDPFDLSHNVTKAIQIRKLNKLRNNCIYSAKILRKTYPYLRSPLLS